MLQLAGAPRPAGSRAEREFRDHCETQLREQGFVTRAVPFTYSALPGRWGTPLAGIVALATLVGAAILGRAGRAGAALALLAISAMLLGAVGSWVARRGILTLPLLRADGVNLVAERGEGTRIWLVAHLDSKSQPVPIGLRALGVISTILVWLALAVIATAALLGADVGRWWMPAGVAGALATVPVMLTTVGARSPGALDNASGVATVLAAATLIPRDVPVGMLLTSAEELGLAGARAWAVTSTPGIALNCDGVDDAGAIVAMHSGPAPERIHRALRETAAALGTSVRLRRLVPGILTDGVALADAGWQVTTVSRGTRATLVRIHTPRDSVAQLRGDGILPTAELLAGAAVWLAHEHDVA